MRKGWIAFVLVQFILLSGCIWNRCEKYTPKNLEYDNLYVDNNGFIIDSNLVFSFRNIAENDSVSKDSFALNVALGLALVAQQDKRHLGSFINSAYALKCQEPIDHILQTIEKIQIKTVNALSSSIPSGSDVTQYFYATINRYQDTLINDDRFIAIASLIEELNDYKYINTWQNQIRTIGNFYLKFSADIGYHQFLISVSTNDGTQFEVKSPLIYLK